MKESEMDKVTHFEIPSDDKGKSTNFYEAVFGWKIAEVPVNMGDGSDSYTTATTTETDPQTMAPTEPGSINGAIIARSDKIKSPVVTITVDSIDARLDKVTETGGKVIEGKQDIEEMGSYAYVQDPAGNVIGLWQDAAKA
jgi:predicted enzyme related to lactoylglutathione lyase